MSTRLHLLGAALATPFVPAATGAQTPPLAMRRLNELGPENGALARRAGL